MKPPTVFQYTDYREYLRAYFKDRKLAEPKFSHRFLARRLGLSAPNFIMLVMQGKRGLTPSLAFKISQEFKHRPEEAEYFQNMVGFDKADITAEKNGYFKRMAELRRKTDVEKIEEWQYEYYSNWYNLAIRELVVNPGFVEDYARLAKMLHIAPYSLRALVNDSAKFVSLFWQSSIEFGFSGYYVSRSYDSIGGYSTISNLLTDTTYLDSAFIPSDSGKIVYYHVTGVFPNSLESNPSAILPVQITFKPDSGGGLPTHQ